MRSKLRKILRKSQPKKEKKNEKTIDRLRQKSGLLIK